MFVLKWSLLSRVQLFATPRTVACQAPLSMDCPGKNTGVGCRALLQGIFLTQGLNPGLLHCRQILYCLSHQSASWSVPRDYKVAAAAQSLTSLYIVQR